jgi:hypothetical protein
MSQDQLRPEGDLRGQHANWARAHARLWTRPVRAMAPIPPAPQPEPEAGSAPFNFLKLPGWQGIVKLVSLKHGVSVSDILGPGRRVPVAAARQEAVYLVFTHCAKSFPETGRLFNRDHTTALHSVRKIERLRAAKC